MRRRELLGGAFAGAVLTPLAAASASGAEKISPAMLAITNRLFIR